MPTVHELFDSLPKRLKTERAKGIHLTVNFDLKGDTQYNFSVKIEEGKCMVYNELQPVANCTVKSQAVHYVKLETGELNPQVALMSGKVKVDRIDELLKFTKLFRKYSAGKRMPKTERPKQKGPLAGIRILDLTRLLPGPLGTMLLAEMGAEVIKIENPEQPDYVREFPPYVQGQSANYLALNRCKKSLTLNIFSESDQETFKKLIRTADVIIEQFRPGVLAKHGLDFESLSKINEKLVYVSLTGYGQNGPKAKEAGHDLNYMAQSGVLSLIKDDRGKPVIPAVQFADVAGGSYMLIAAVTTALLARNTQQKAQFVDVSMLDGLMPLMTLYHAHYQVTGQDITHQKHMLAGALVNYNVYECSDGKWLALGALEPKFWMAFCNMIGKGEWKNRLKPDPEKQQLWIEELAILLKGKSRAYWLEQAEGKEVCLTAILTVDEVAKDKHLLQREIFYTTKSALIQGIGNPIKFQSYPHTVSWPAPELGEDQNLLDDL